MPRFVDFAEQPAVIVGKPSGPAFWEEGAEDNSAQLGIWDVVELAGKKLPGVAELRGSLKRRTDKKKTPGKNGTTVTHLGFDAAQFRITLRLWTEEHLRKYEDVVQQFREEDPKKLKGIDVYHPALAMYRIHSLQVLEAGLPTPAGKGVLEVTLECIEFIDPASKKGGVGTAKSSKSYGLDTMETAVPPPSKPSLDPLITGPGGRG